MDVFLLKLIIGILMAETMVLGIVLGTIWVRRVRSSNIQFLIALLTLGFVIANAIIGLTTEVWLIIHLH